MSVSNRPETRCSSISFIELSNELLGKLLELENLGQFYSNPTEIVRLGECLKILPTCAVAQQMFVCPDILYMIPIMKMKFIMAVIEESFLTSDFNLKAI